MRTVKFLIYFMAFFAAEATIHVCVSPHLTDATTVNLDEKLQEIKSNISKKIAADENEPDIQMEHVVLDIVHPAVSVQGTVDNFRIYNLSDFTICFFENMFVNSSYYQFDVFNITFSNLRAEGIYNITGDLGDIFDIYGDGKFWFELRNFSVAMVNFTFNVTEEICFPVNLEIDLRDAGNLFDNFMYDAEMGDLLNRAIASIFPEAIKIIWGEWQEIFDQPLEDEINSLLHPNDISAILNALKKMENIESTAGKYCYTNN